MRCASFFNYKIFSFEITLEKEVNANFYLLDNFISVPFFFNFEYTYVSRHNLSVPWKFCLLNIIIQMITLFVQYLSVIRLIIFCKASLHMSVSFFFFFNR